jgi:tyrosyl-tRNA synthetase
MEAKKRLARTIVAGFHSEAASRKADEDWAMQFQQKDLSAVTDEAKVDFRRIVRADAVSIGQALRDPGRPIFVDVAKLLVELGLKDSRTDAERQVNAGVGIDGVTSKDKLLKVESRPARIAVRVGKRAKIAVIE